MDLSSIPVPGPLLSGRTPDSPVPGVASEEENAEGTPFALAMNQVMGVVPQGQEIAASQVPPVPLSTTPAGHAGLPDGVVGLTPVPLQGQPVQGEGVGPWSASWEGLGTGGAVARPPGWDAVPLNGVALKSSELGLGMRLITSEQAALSDDSLMAFAKSQGLGERALQQLFGQQAEPAQADPWSISPGAAQTPEWALDVVASQRVLAAWAGGLSRPVRQPVSAGETGMTHAVQGPMTRPAETQTLDLTAVLEPGDEGGLAGPEESSPMGESWLGRRLGEAMAQRLMAQVERGQWRVQLQLKPEQLGQVSVELTMRGGELDARLTTLAPLTRDLLNEGVGRLREVLNQLGMDVANISIDGGQFAQNGGNLTPRRPSLPEGGSPAEGPVDDPSAEARETRSVGPLNGEGGWDVWV